jgi:membrane protease YdiL (CAAX protease family)
MGIRLVFAVVAIILFAIEFDTLKEVVWFYLRPGSMPLELRLLRTKKSKLLSVLALNFGTIFFLSAVLPASNATSNSDLPKGLLELVEIIGLAAFLEELVFRIVPWFFLFVLRKLTKRNNWLERTNVIAALLIATLFGLVHVTNYTNPDTGAYLSCLNQVAAALLFWYILEKDGLASSTAAHIILNLMLILPFVF